MSIVLFAPNLCSMRYELLSSRLCIAHNGIFLLDNHCECHVESAYFHKQFCFQVAFFPNDRECITPGTLQVPQGAEVQTMTKFYVTLSAMGQYGQVLGS